MAIPRDRQDAIDIVRDSKDDLLWQLICQWAERRQNRATDELKRAEDMNGLKKAQGKLEAWEEVLRLPELIISELQQQKETDTNA